MNQPGVQKPVPLTASMLADESAAGTPPDDEKIAQGDLERLDHLFRNLDAQCPDDPLRRLVTAYRQSHSGTEP